MILAIILSQREGSLKTTEDIFLFSEREHLVSQGQPSLASLIKNKNKVFVKLLRAILEVLLLKVISSNV